MTIRPALESDIPEVAALWHEAFPGKRTIEDRARMLEVGGRYGGLETVLVARTEDDRLAGACKLYRMELHLAGVPLPMMGLAAVAVAPSERRRGLGARLCGEAMTAAVDRGDVLSVLYPFRPDYYERLGWGLVGELHHYRAHTSALPASPDAGHVREARLRDDAAAIAECYQRVARTSNGPITRDRKVWAYRLTGQELGVRPVDPDVELAVDADPRRRVVVYDDTGVDGYALLRYVSRADGAAVQQVRELVAASERAYRGLLGYLAGQAEHWPVTRHFARPEERFGDRLRDPRPPGHGKARSLYFPTARTVRGPMLRVLDVPAALERRRWFDADGGRGAPGLVRLVVGDAQRPENQGPWWVRIAADGSCTVAPEDPDGAADPHESRASQSHTSPSHASLQTDAATFARIFAGDLPATDAARMGRARLSGGHEWLDRAVATRETFWLLDEF